MIALRAVSRGHRIRTRKRSRLDSLRFELFTATAAAVIFVGIARIGAVSTPIQQSAVTYDVDDIKRLQQSAENGDAKAQFSLALIYDSGEGVAQDTTDAAKWYRRAADQRPDAGIGRDQSQHVAAPRRAGNQPKHPGAVEARHTIGADVCSSGFADRLSIEQYGNRRIP